MDGKTAQLQALLAPIVEEAGFALWAVEYVLSRGSGVLRVFIEHSERLIVVEDCVLVSRAISAAFEVNDPVPGEYNLEVSSPGFDRPLCTLAHFERFVGSQVRLETLLPKAGRKRYRGEILAVDGQNVVLKVDQQRFEIGFAEVAKARVVPDFSKL